MPWSRPISGLVTWSIFTFSLAYGIFLNGLKRNVKQIKHGRSSYSNSPFCRVDLEASSTFLENECFRKYGKSGKSFYYSQVASTVRWLTTTSSSEITKRIGIVATSPPENITCEEEPHLTSSSTAFHQREENSISGDIESEISASAAMPLQSASSPVTKPPPIPSFSQFVNSKKSKDSRSNAAKEKHSPEKRDKSMKRMRFQ